MWPFLHKPYPYNSLSWKDLRTNFLIGCFVAAFLLVFEPFNIALWETPQRSLKILGFGLVSFLCPMIFKTLLSLMLRGGKPEETWKVWQEILVLVLVLLFIAAGNLLYGKLIGIVRITPGHFSMAVAATFLLGIFPVTANVALKYNRFLALNQAAAHQLESELRNYETRREEPANEPSVPAKPGLVELVAENNKDKLFVSPDELVYIESADNYSTVVLLRDGICRRELIRASLKRLESQIHVAHIMRCHRSYIVNVRHAAQVTGNAQGYRIGFNIAGMDAVPVSRSYGKEVLAQIRALA